MEEAQVALMEQEASSVRTVGIQLRAVIAFVFLTAFKPVFGCLPEHVGFKVATLLGLGGKLVDCVCFWLIASWPDEIPHWGGGDYLQ